MRRALLAVGLLVAASALAQAIAPASRGVGLVQNVADGGLQIFDHVTSGGPFLDLYPLDSAGNSDGYVWRLHTPQTGRGGADWAMAWKDAPGYDGGSFSGDSVMSWGYNVNQPETDKPRWSVNLESYFLDLSEFHVAWTGPLDGTWAGMPNPRVITCAVVNATGHADCGHVVDQFYLDNGSETNIHALEINLTPEGPGSYANFYNGLGIIGRTNNQTWLRQADNTGSTTLTLVYADDNNRIQLGDPAGKAGLPLDTLLQTGRGESGLVTVAYVNGTGTLNTSQYAIQIGRVTLDGSGNSTQPLNFGPGTPICTCSAETAGETCSLNGTPTNSQVLLKGTASHVVHFNCFGP